MLKKNMKDGPGMNYETLNTQLACLVHLNLKGGPSNTASVLSSDAVTIRKGRAGRKSTELMGLD